MNRRSFVKKSLITGSLPFWLQSCDLPGGRVKFPIEVQNDQHVGHLVFESQKWSHAGTEKLEVAIVGGGVAGLTAAYGLGNKDFRLFELSHRLGGSSASASFEGISLCQGAHYDLEYPDYYGPEVLEFLEKLNIIHYEPWKRTWAFDEKDHYIPFHRRQQCFDQGQRRKDVMRNGPEKDRFLEIVTPYLGKMPLPTRLIDQETRDLDKISFLSFLQAQMPVSSELRRSLDYHMMDDYGGKTHEVSALAGVHYFACRPYYQQPVNLFSPPSGNDYFIQKIVRHLASDKLQRNHLVNKIEGQKGNFRLEVLDIEKRRKKQFLAKEIIYAGQKHALKYIYPAEYHWFEKNKYAPWMVINFIADQLPGEFGFWQNEFLGDDNGFLGFIDSSTQRRATLKNHRVFTAYYCLSPNHREYLSAIPESKEKIVLETKEKIELMLGKKIIVKQALIHIMGHAMPVPFPGYLFRKSSNLSHELIYAGVDCGRLPLIFEALDSGLMASKKALS